MDHEGCEREEAKGAKGERTSRELGLATERVPYEVRMLRPMADVVGRFVVENDDEATSRGIGDALKEGVILHCGLLVHFLYADQPGPEEVIAEDFFDDPAAWREKRSVKSERLARIEWAYRGITRLGCGRPEQLRQAVPVDLSRAGSEIKEVLREFAWTAPTARMNQALWEFLTGPRKAGESGRGA